MSRVYEVIKVCGREHVICDVPRRHQPDIADANYMGTGKALCGVLWDGETLQQWLIRRDKRRLERYALK